MAFVKADGGCIVYLQTRAGSPRFDALPLPASRACFSFAAIAFHAPINLRFCMMQQTAARTRLGLLAWIAISFVPAATAVFVEPGVWYESLNRPAWTPPSWVFGPVWTLLYLLMGVAAWLVWRRHGVADRSSRLALTLFLAHLLFNAAWTWLFFGQHLLTVAAIEIVILWAMILALVALFWRLDRTAGLLLVPYLLWVTYASTLSIGFAMMN